MPLEKSQQLRKLVIVVLYEHSLLESDTVKSLITSHNLLSSDDIVFVWDNSHKAQPDTSVERLQSLLPANTIYHHSQTNTPLSRVYNSVLGKNYPTDITLFFDQDSAFDATYFAELQEAYLLYPEVNLFLPLIKNKNKVVSPGSYAYFKGKYWQQEHYGLVPAQNNIAIMSGMAIRSSFLKEFGQFDERLKLYGIDTNFMIRYGRNNKFFFVLKAPFAHDLSEYTISDFAAKLQRFKDFRKASLVNSSLFPLPQRALTLLFLTYRTLKLYLLR